MKTKIFHLLLIPIFFSCVSGKKDPKPSKIDLEIDIINSTLSEIVPKYPLCVPAPIEGESKTEYTNRIKKLKSRLDSTGMTLELKSHLKPINPTVLEYLLKEEKNSKFKMLKNAPKSERKIDFSLIKNYKNVKVTESTSEIFEFNCKTIGVIEYSRMAFNKDSTLAVFQFNFSDGSCLGGKGGTILVEKEKKKWVIKK